MKLKSAIKKNQIKILHVELGERSYPITIGNRVLNKIGNELKELHLLGKIGVVTNPTVGALYGKPVMQSLKKAGFSPTEFIVPDGEAYKSLDSAKDLYHALLSERFDRESTLLALGGGVIGDLTGFVAATFLRGIPFIQVPTTLESQVDASVGGKVAVDLPEGKNLVGAFYQPKGVLIDTNVLSTLPLRELSAGLAEVIKYGMIWDAKFFGFLEKNIEKVFHLDSIILQKIIFRSCNIKSEVVSKDETDRGLRGILNFGHTIGHAIETITGYEKFRHGEGVALGMIVESLIAVKMNLFDTKSLNRLIQLTRSANLPILLPKLNIQKLIEIMYLDKKVKNNRIRMILPHSIGRAKMFDNIDLNIVKISLKQAMERGKNA